MNPGVVQNANLLMVTVTVAGTVNFMLTEVAYQTFTMVFMSLAAKIPQIHLFTIVVRENII
jgi:hypothetical protein